MKVFILGVNAENSKELAVGDDDQEGGPQVVAGEVEVVSTIHWFHVQAYLQCGAFFVYGDIQEGDL